MPSDGWHRLSAGAGAKGPPRRHDWAYAAAYASDAAPGWEVTRITLSHPPVTKTATGAWNDRATLPYA